MKSSLCKQEELESDLFQFWVHALHQNPKHINRKTWEWCYIAQALHEKGMIAPGKKGIGFAVGKEPLAALFAKNGCKILATDQSLEKSKMWIEANQHCSRLEDLNTKGICDPQTFKDNVNFMFLDMNYIPSHLKNFDFCWSSGSFEHIGSSRLGKQFVYNAMNCLKPGGVAVHTSEYNVTSNNNTLETHNLVLYRRKDYEEIAATLRHNKHKVAEFDFYLGDKPVDLYIDQQPYNEQKHLKLQIGEYVTTSLGFVVTKSKMPRLF
jgi:SAM-dependent methyltransferase